VVDANIPGNKFQAANSSLDQTTVGARSFFQPWTEGRPEELNEITRHDIVSEISLRERRQRRGQQCRARKKGTSSGKAMNTV
jgi:hypothetical protein